MEELVVPLLAALGLTLLLVVLAAAFVLRRQGLARRRASFDCSLRLPDGHWSLGVARYGYDRLEWFRVFSFSLRPKATWRRGDLTVVDRRPTQGSEVTAVVPQAVVVHCRHRGDDLDLAMTEDAYTGLASWLESAPPGQTARVT